MHCRDHGAPLQSPIPSRATARAATAGQCGAVTLATGQNGIQLGLDATHVYWLNFDATTGLDTLMMKLKDGTGTATALTTDLNRGGCSAPFCKSPAGPVILGSPPSAYWVQPAISVWSFGPLGSATAARSQLSSDFLPGVAIDATAGATDMFWNDSNAGAGGIDSVGIGGVDLHLLHACNAQGLSCLYDTTAPVAIAADATNVYWTDTMAGPGTATGTVNGGPIRGLGGTVPAPLATAQNPSTSPGSLAVFNGNLYWVNQASVMAGIPFTGNIMRIPVTGGTPVSIQGTSGSPVALAVDATGIYWLDGAAGSLLRVPLAGAVTATTLATGQGTGTLPGTVTLDATKVYWTNTTAGRVMAIAK